MQSPFCFIVKPYNDRRYDNIKYYGDILIFKVNENDILLDINTNEYESIYNKLYYNNDSHKDDPDSEEKSHSRIIY